MLFATAALRRAAAASSSEGTTTMILPLHRRCLSSVSPSSSTPASPLHPSASHDPSLHVQLEPLSTPDGVEGVFTLTLCRPSARNAVGRRLLSELRGCLEALAAESPASARALVLRSAVPGAFCAGADLRERAAMTRLEARRFVEELRATVGMLEALPFPTVAAVDGVALGGGAELALAADVRVVGPRASFGFPETRLGIIPG
jgi:methylglutaconyl-CoA hydratase